MLWYFKISPETKNYASKVSFEFNHFERGLGIRAFIEPMPAIITGAAPGT